MNIERTLEPSEAILAMLDGEILYIGENKECFYDRESEGFRARIIDCCEEVALIYFSGIHRKIIPQKRYMTRNECLFWATSPESIGYVVRGPDGDDWCCPQQKDYYGKICHYQRVKLDSKNKYKIKAEDIESFEVEE